jgi:LPPG:FO 2-phospho-L-lactate transferase
VLADGRWWPLQEFLILARGTEPEAVEFEGIEGARPSREVLAALAAAEVIVIGPSNPVISIGPILAVPGMRDAIAASDARVVAVSPFVGGRAVKGPTEAFCRQAGLPLGTAAVELAYSGLIHGVVADEPGSTGLPATVVPTLMDTAEDRRRVAAETLDLGRRLAGA